MDGESTDDDVVAMRARMKAEERLRRRREIVAIHKREWHLSTKQIADYLGLPARYVEQTLQETGRIPKEPE
jgi:predicted ArsR family transcriptional regulator